MITGAAQMDGAILILSAQDGSKEQTKEHLLLAKQIGIEYLVVFLNKVDMVSDLEEIDLVKEEIKEDLRKAGYDAEKIPIIGGSALCALEGRNPEMGEEKISDLLDAIDNYIPTPQRNVDAPFKMYIKDIISITGQGTVVTGDVEQGVLKRGQEVEISGLGNETIKTVATSIEMHKKELEEARAGDDVGIKLRGVKKEQITRGQLLSVAIKGTKIKTYNKFFATAYILSREERGRHTNFRDGYRPQFYLAATDVTGTIELKDKSQEVAPGSTVEFTVNLIKPLAIEKNEKFIIREGGHTVGQGTILETLE
ncbi:1292_t:CDS:1 [Funneliformis geosporum]|uniref:Elongation factor Tu, mitochondrial n=1 Tax=Funneliformis geosporum TaxID=1117311 RepID=A0A9W4S9I5_9GLOM|nr:1292_t:CDS:1 [Funneliformis geosporum]